MASKYFIIFLVAALIVGVIVFVQMGSDPEEEQIQITNFEECVAAGNPVMESYPRQCRSASGQLFVEEIEESPNNSAGGTQPEGQPSITEFSFEADDDGYYMNGEEVSSISATLGSEVGMTFNVRTTNVYYAGLDFRGCGIDSGKIAPGDSTTQTFTVENSCIITSYWPSSGVVKARLRVNVD